MITRRSKEEITRDMLAGVVQETSINMVGRGSQTRGLALAIASQIEKSYDTLDTAVVNSYLATASGFFLDLVGETFGILRRQPSNARILASDRSVRFFVRSGSLAARLPHPTDAGLGRVPSGTQVYGPNGITFTVDNDTNFPAAAKEVFVGVTSGDVGSSQNAGVATLNSHNLASPDVQVTNDTSVATGSDLESDEEFRFRISKWLTTSAGRNETSIRLAVLSTPGVADMIRVPYHLGAGSFKIVLIPTGNVVSAETMRQVYSNVQSTVSEGTFFQILPPRYVNVAMTIRLIPQPNHIITEVERALVEQSVLSFLGSVRPGKTLVINQLKSAILSTSTGISDVSIQALSIDGRPNAIVNFTLESDELFIPDPNFDDPILVV